MSVPVEKLLANIVEAFIEVDAELRVVHINANAEILLRREARSAIGQRLDELISDAKQSQHWPAFLETVKGRRNDAISVFYPAQYRWHDIKVIPLEGGGTALLVRDVTDRQWLIRREAERVYLKSVFEDAPVAITVLRGKALVVEYMNALARQITGERKVMGWPIRDAFADVEQRELFDILDGVYATGEPFHGRGMFVRFDRNQDGTLEDAYFDVSYQAVRDFDGTISGILSISIDVSDRTRAAGT